MTPWDNAQRPGCWPVGIKQGIPTNSQLATSVFQVCLYCPWSTVVLFCFQFWFCGQHVSVHKYPGSLCFGKIQRCGVIQLGPAQPPQQPTDVKERPPSFSRARPTCPLHSFTLLFGSCEHWPFNTQWGHIQGYWTRLLMLLMARLPRVTPKSFHHGSGSREILFYSISYLS